MAKNLGNIAGEVFWSEKILNRLSVKKVIDNKDIVVNTPSQSIFIMEHKIKQEFLEKYHNMEILHNYIQNELQHPLRQFATNTVLGRGNPHQKHQLMFIGEGPGEQEDQQSLAFVGASGQLLDKILTIFGINAITKKSHEQDYWITNTVFWRPPQNRAPTTKETDLCLPAVLSQIYLLKPKKLVLLGGVALKTIMPNAEGIMRVHGQNMQLKINDFIVPVVATMHPSYLLRAPMHKALAYQDFLQICS